MISGIVYRLIFFKNIILQLKDHKSKDGTDKPCLSPTVLKSQKKMKLPDTAGKTLLQLNLTVNLE